METGSWAGPLLIGAAALLLALSAVRLSARIGVPTLLAYLALGIALGESGAGIRFDDAALARELGFLALALILAEGGLTTRWGSIRPVLPVATILATVGVLASTLLVAVAAHYLLGQSWQVALLLGAIMAPTDAAAVFATLRALPIRPAVGGVLEAESGLNDPLALILVAGLAGTGSHLDLAHVALEVVVELAVGAVVGATIGALGRVYLVRVALPAAGLYPLAVLGFALVGYAGADLLHGSGFLAVYLAALILGNARLPHRRATLGFAEGLAWLAQIGLFVMLGLLASPSRLGGAVLSALLVGAVLVLVARPAAVVLSTLAFRISWRSRAFLSWAGLRGAVPIVLATLPLSAGLPDGTRLFDVVFLLVAALTLLQAPTLPWVARRLGVALPESAVDLAVEAAPLAALDADLLHLEVGRGSGLHGMEVWELRLPAVAAVSLLVREGRSIVPDRWTRLQRGDQLLVVVPLAARRETEQRLDGAGRYGALARWRDPGSGGWRKG